MASLRWSAFAILFGTGLACQQPQFHGAEWPGTDPGPAQRVWCAVQADGQQIWLRRTFRVEKPITSARCVVSCDNRCEVWINGKPAVKSAADWQELVVHDVSGRLQPGDNTIAVLATNDDGPAALAVWCQWFDAGGAGHAVVTDVAWRVAEQDENGWAAPAFDDSAWQPATVLGPVPFGRNAQGLEPSTLHWRGPVDDALQPVAAAVAAAQRCRDPEAALRALEQVEQSLVQARQQLWEHVQRSRAATGTGATGRK